MTLILASSSPRRHELLRGLGIEFSIVASDFDEESVDSETPEALVRLLAACKANEVASKHPGAVVLGADTIVVHDGEVLGKPVDAADARRMLARLRGNEHRVYTGVALVRPGAAEPLVRHLATDVLMRPFSDAEIAAWIESGGPFDKAGAYAVQSSVFQPVESWRGCYCNVMGLPVWTVAAMLRENGVQTGNLALPDRCATCPESREIVTS